MSQRKVKDTYKKERKKKSTGLIRRFLPYYKKYWKTMVFDLFCASLTTVCELVLPLIVRFLTDKGINDLPSLTPLIIVKVGIIYLMLRVIDATANYFMQSVGHVMGTKMETDMRRDLFSHIEKQSFSYFDNTKIGQLMSRITSDLFDVTEFAHHCPEEFFIAGIKIIVSFIILLNFNITLTIIIFTIIPFMIMVSLHFRRRMRSAFKKSRVQIGELNSQIEDSLLGIRVVKSFANEPIEEEKFKERNHRFLDIKKEMYRYMAGFHSSTRIFDGIMYITVVVFGALFMIGGKIEAPEYMAYLLYVQTLLTSIRRIVEFTEQFERGMTGIERFCEVMDTPVDIKNLPQAEVLDNVCGKIEFRNVRFRYKGTEGDVLCGIDLVVNPGESIAIAGPSGSGKSTICNLIPRFYEINEGEILIDGKNINDLTLQSLRGNIGMVQQDVYLFSGSVYENIEYGKPGAKKEEIIEAAKKAGAHEFIMALENGYDTYVGERGVKLSGGQKQRLSIARLFLKNPPILILDEATSALDNESERLVQMSLEELAKGRTTFTIAHRLSTIRNADKILVLTEKGIEEKGTHSELIAKKGIYYDLYKLSNPDFEN